MITAHTGDLDNEYLLDTLVNIGLGLEWHESPSFDDVRRGQDEEWGVGNWSVIAGAGVTLPNSYNSTLHTFRTPRVPANQIIVFRKNAGILPQNSGPTYSAMVGVTFHRDGPKAEMMEVPAHSFGLFIDENLIHRFQPNV